MKSKLSLMWIKKIVSEVLCIEDILFSLLSAFLVFNIQYLVGCSNFYAFMEVRTFSLYFSDVHVTLPIFFQ